MSITVTSIDFLGNGVSPLWIERSHVLRSEPLYSTGEIKFDIKSGYNELYEYFPTSVFVILNDEPRAVIEFSGPNETFAVTIQTNPGGHNIELRFECEQARSPADAGLGADRRELGALMSSLRFEPAERQSQPEVESRPPIPFGPMKHFDLRKEEPEPIFVIGCYRSGTSIAAWALGQHPNIYPMEETNWLPTLCHGAVAAYTRASGAARSAPMLYDLSLSEFLQWQGIAIDKLHRTLSEDRWQKLVLARTSAHDEDFDTRFQLMRSRYAPKRRWVDATPENTSVGPHLARMFPRGKFLHALRAPEGVIRSLMAFDAAGGARHTFEEAAESWERLNQWAYELACDLGPARVMTMPFEDLTRSPAELLPRIWRFLEEPDFHRSLETFGERINSSNVGAGGECLDVEKMARLNAIHGAMREGAPFDEVPWTLEPDPASARNHHISAQIQLLTS